MVPFTPSVPRRSVRRPPMLTPASRNVRVLERFLPGRLSDPIRYGDTPSRPSMQQIATFLHIAPYRNVMRDDFWVHTIAPTPGADVPGWGMSSFATRPNIHREPAEAYGSLVASIGE